MIKFFSEDSISVKQFIHFKKSISKAFDKQLALNKSFDVSDKEFHSKYPFLDELKKETSKNHHKADQIDSMAVILNNYFNSAWKDKGRKSLKLKRDLEKDLEQILYLIFRQNESEEIIEKVEIKKFNSFFKSLKQYQQLIKLLQDNNFFSEKRNPKPIELNILLLKIEKLNLLKHEYNQYELVDSARCFFKVTKKGSLSRLKTSYNDGSMTDSNTERFEQLHYLDIMNHK